MSLIYCRRIRASGYILSVQRSITIINYDHRELCSGVGKPAYWDNFQSTVSCGLISTLISWRISPGANVDQRTYQLEKIEGPGGTRSFTSIIGAAVNIKGSKGTREDVTVNQVAFWLYRTRCLLTPWSRPLQHTLKRRQENPVIVVRDSCSGSRRSWNLIKLGAWSPLQLRS